MRLVTYSPRAIQGGHSRMAGWVGMRVGRWVNELVGIYKWIQVDRQKDGG